MTEQQIVEHDRAYKEAAGIVQREIQLYERPNMPRAGWGTRRKLKRALSLFSRALEIHPENWSAMWLVGKVHQRLGDYSEALSWFERAYQVNPSQPDVAREAAACAMSIGNHDSGISFAHRAIQIEPTSYGLHANLALAFLLADRIADAQASIERAVAGDPADSISRTIQAIVRHFATNGRKPPTTTPELEAYWRKNRNA